MQVMLSCNWLWLTLLCFCCLLADTLCSAAAAAVAKGDCIAQLVLGCIVPPLQHQLQLPLLCQPDSFPALPPLIVAAAVAKGDRIAQLVLECIVTPDVEVVEDLDDTSRGAGGFGSTGVAAKQ
jgi:hypothetical protein